MMIPRELLDVFRALSGELNTQALMQLTIDAATRFTRAEFGAFFYSDPSEDTYSLYVLAGASHESFGTFPPVRKTELFRPTFESKKIVRVADVKEDERHGKNTPFMGLRTGHLPVRSYMAVPVVSRSDIIFGAILFGHPDPDVFDDGCEEIATAIAAQSAVALDNAHLYQQAQEAIRTRDDFLSIAAHEIRNSLTPLKLRLEMMDRLVKNTCPNAQLIGSIDVCRRQVTRLTTLIEELLDVSRIRTGRLSMNYTQFDMVALLGDILERYEPQAHATGCIFMFKPPEQPIIGRWDLERIQQVFINLLANAMQYAPESIIETKVRRRNGDVVVQVCDDGPGIPFEDQQRIFNQFDRADDKTKRGGLGLGLYIGRKIVEAHDGEITVDSEPGSGTCFTVMLPLTPHGKEDDKEIAFGG